MIAALYDDLRARWAFALPDVPFTFPLDADPNVVIHAMADHLSTRMRRPPTVVTNGEVLAVEIREKLQAPRKPPTEAA